MKDETITNMVKAIQRYYDTESFGNPGDDFLNLSDIAELYLSPVFCLIDEEDLYENSGY